MQHKNTLNGTIGALKIISPDSFSFAGKTFVVNANKFSQPAGIVSSDPFVKLLTEILYQQCYCRKFNGTYYESPPVTEDNGQFQTALSKANSTIERWDKGWIVEQILPTGQYVARKNGKYKLLYPGAFITTDYQTVLPNEGTRIIIHCLKESFGFQSAFYFAFSHEISDQQNLLTMVRFYWNIKSSGAPKLIDLLTKNLNTYHIPFSFKCLNNFSSFIRSDAAVLYISKHHYNITAQILSGIYPQISSELNEEVPEFTKELKSGLGFAEDPGTGESFGMSRCRMVAQGIYNAHQSGFITNKKIIYHIKEVFNARGVKINLPYLNAGSKDIYEFID